MSQVQQMQQYQALQQIMQRNSFEQLQSQPPTSQLQPPVQVDDDDEEVVPESPPQELKHKKNKWKGKTVETVPETAPKSGSRAKARPWTKIEEEALAMAFVKSSTCPIIGNNQTGSSFWKATTERFNGIMKHGPARYVEYVSGKWHKMSKTINTFNGYYNQIYTCPPSESNDENILNLAIAKRDSQNSTPFPHLLAWNVLKKEPKWKAVPNDVATAKRTKTFESGSYSAGGSTARC
ncbi:glutathione S-transferase T3-like [Helianthus annuus]|uniref:glutathione S-transferase T3-like n=1 Tax=Helianthus annuus TaxID=4232 RepID=UPI000B8FAD62|nr:glutathione S-transferase T3-like [Helianthus annuus]